MRIEEDLKLGFKDVLIRPKRSTLKSRSEVELEREYTFKHSGWKWSGVPVIAANMDTVGTFRMAEALASFDVLTAVHKHYTVEQWQQFVQRSSESVLRHVMVSTGTSEADFVKMKQALWILRPCCEVFAVKRISWICLRTLCCSILRMVKQIKLWLETTSSSESMKL